MKYKREINFGTTKYPREKILNPRNTHEDKFCTHEIPMGKKIWAHEIPTKINFGPTKCQKKKRLDSGNNHEKNFRTTKGTMGRLHKTLDGIRLTEFSTPLSKSLLDAL